MELLQKKPLKEQLQFPVDIYVKENGYLGILGFDATQHELFIASKSTIHGPYAERFGELLLSTISNEIDLMNFLHKNQVSMTFEVIDPVFDPHIIEYQLPQIILLDVIHRTPSFQKYSYEEVQKVGRQFGLPVKQHLCRFNDWDSFNKWYQNVSTDFTLELEGYVLEDSHGFMTKIKLPYYIFWKRMRNLVSIVLQGEPLPQEWDSHPIATSFYIWLKERTHSQLTQTDSIIDLRNQFYYNTRH